MEKAVRDGYYLAGFFSYEAGYHFEKRLQEGKKYDFPLIMMGVYSAPRRQDFFAGNSTSRFELSDMKTNVDRCQYDADIGAIRDYIQQGEVYQITYCIKAKFKFSGETRDLFRRLYDEQPVPYSAYVRSDDFSILSLSPERLIHKQQGHLTTEPMKGTWPRGGNVISDRMARFRFARDRKNRAENVMIADLLRNDLGRVGEDVHAPKLFTVTPYRTLYQMTSTVTGRVLPDIPLYELFSAIFPSGSVTGAPKIRAMQVIRELEDEDRRIYTGAIGYITPARDLYFNVPIRTLLIRDGQGEMGVGGGIVWDSTADGEWAEGVLKAKFLTDLIDQHKHSCRS